VGLGKAQAALLVSLLLSSCGHVPAEPPEESLIVVGVSQVGSESGFRVANSESMRAVFTEDNGYQLLFDDARQKQENQISAIRKFIQQQVDYIVLMPLCETGWGSVLQEAKDANIPVILVDRMVGEEYEHLYTAHIGSNFLREGELAADWMEKRYLEENDPVYIVHIQGTPGSSAQLGRTAALEHVVARHENWEVAAQLDGDFTQAKTYEVMSEYLDSIPDGQEISLVYCENDNEAFGAVQALEEQGYTCGNNGVEVIAFDATQLGLSYCLEGRISLDVECNPLLGPLVEDTIQTLEAGGCPEKHRYLEEKAYTKDTLTEEFIANRMY